MTTRRREEKIVASGDGPQPRGRSSLVSPRRATAIVVALLATWLAPRAAEARVAQDPTEAEQEQAEVRERAGEVALEIDVIEAQVAEIATALADLQANVAAQETALNDANEAADTAASNLEAAETAVADTEARVTQLELASDALAADSFMAPPSDAMIDSLQTSSVNDRILIQALVEMQATEDASVLDQLEQAQVDLEAQRGAAEEAATQAEAARGAAQGAYDEVVAARDQQAQFAAEAQDALDHRLTESANLAAMDAELSEQIAEEQAELARQLAAAGAGAGEAEVIGDVTVRSVTCSNGNTITVADSIADNVQSMLNAAAADGVLLCGWGYRSSDEQIALREQNCGTSEYAIYQMPASSCSPPTARPGTSEHEKGLAIDFENCSSQSSECFGWLDGNAATYGMYNYPVEPWHWSTTGT